MKDQQTNGWAITCSKAHPTLNDPKRLRHLIDVFIDESGKITFDDDKVTLCGKSMGEYINCRCGKPYRYNDFANLEVFLATANPPLCPECRKILNAFIAGYKASSTHSNE